MTKYGMLALSLVLVLLVAGCASTPVDQVDLMPAPDVYGDGLINPLPESNPWDKLPYKGVLYATEFMCTDSRWYTKIQS